MKLLFQNNFLHYGDSLEKLRKINFSTSFQGEIPKHELVDQLANQKINDRYLREIILNYETNRRRKIDILRFEQAVQSSFILENMFRKLGCRGFSYDFYDKMKGFPFRLRKEINLRLALLTTADLFYPPKVRKYLTSIRSTHYSLNGYPSIGFALGSIIENDWYIFVIQSDLVFEKMSFIREHFRGWRKVLFANIVKYARDKAESIFLCTAEDLLKCCHIRYMKPDKLPKNWKIFYDETAKFFDMKITRTEAKVNIQIFHGHKPIYTNRFHKLSFAQNSLPKRLEL